MLQTAAASGSRSHTDDDFTTRGQNLITNALWGAKLGYS